MTKEKTPRDCKNESVVEGLYDVSAEDSEHEEEGITNEEELDSKPAVKQSGDVDDGGPLSI